MDLICVRCGEPWYVDHVLYEEPEGFDRRGGLIRSCPSCANKPLAEKTPAEKERLDKIRVIAELLGDDIDACAVMIDDFEYFLLLTNSR